MPPPAPPRRQGGCLRGFSLLVTVLSIIYVLYLDGGGGGGTGTLPSSSSSSSSTSSGRGAWGSPQQRMGVGGGGSSSSSSHKGVGGGRPSRALPSGVNSLYPPSDASHLDVFGPEVTRIIITFIGPHMNLWYATCLRALILQHCHVPNVRVLVWANELTEGFLESSLGDVLHGEGGVPRLHLVRYNVTELAAGAPAASDTLDFLMYPPGGDIGGVQPTMEPQVRMAHITDVVRMVVLWRFGGVYLDADILPLKPLHALGVVYAANLGNYECTKALYPGWPDGQPFTVPARLGGATVSCMCICFLSFPTPGHVVIREVLTQGLAAFKARSCVYGGLGAWLFMDVLRALVDDPALDARPMSVSQALCWPQVLDAVPPQTPDNVDAILRECTSVHMMGGAHAKKFGATTIGNDTLFGQVYTRLQAERLPTSCSAASPHHT